jgi:hypothetical protein
MKPAQKTRLKKFIWLLLGLSLIFIDPAYALRCGNEVVQIGDSATKVLHMCGKPTAKEKIKIKKEKRFNNNADGSKITQWTYNFGSSDFLYIISFQKGVVSSITANGYGY